MERSSAEIRVIKRDRLSHDRKKKRLAPYSCLCKVTISLMKFSRLCRDSTERGGNETHANGHPSCNDNDSRGSKAPTGTRGLTCG